MTAADELHQAAALLRTARSSGAMTVTPVLAALVRSRHVLADWLDSWTGVDLNEHGPMPEDAQHALAVARQLLGTGEQPETETAPVPLAVGDRYVHHTEDRTVTITRLWVDEYGCDAVAFEWSGGMCSSAHTAEVFHRLHRPAATGEAIR